MAVRVVVLSATAITALICSSPAFAELPQAVRAMIDAAIATGDKGKVATVIELARQTNPKDAAEIDAIVAVYKTDLAEREKAQAAVKEQEIREAGLFERWNGKGELGASQSTGNTDIVGLSLGLMLERTGIDWTHKVRATADYQRSTDATTREQLFASYEPRYQIDDGLFAYGLAQFERDPLQGFSGRYVASGGLGYKLIDGKKLSLAVKAGPAYRVTDFVVDGSETSFAGLAGLDFDWRISDGLSLTQDTSAVAEGGGRAAAIFGGGNTSINFVTGLAAKISSHFGARLSYTIDYDSNPPDGAVSTDTLSRLTVVYDF
jgi:putative salt-induced outer membrane protein